jgi:hypothetical protein
MTNIAKTVGESLRRGDPAGRLYNRLSYLGFLEISFC